MNKLVLLTTFIFALFSTTTTSASPTTLEAIEVNGAPIACISWPTSGMCKDALRDIARRTTIQENLCYNYPNPAGYSSFCKARTEYEAFRRTIIVNDPVYQCERHVWEWVERATAFNTASGVMRWESYLATPIMRHVCAVNTCGVPGGPGGGQ